MRRYAYSYTLRACRQRWRMPIPLREQFDQVVRELAERPAAADRERALCVADVGRVGSVYYQVLGETGQLVVAECVLSSAAAEAA